MIESTAVIFSLLSVILTTKKNQLCWPVGIIGVIFYGYIFYQNKDWSNFILQFVFIVVFFCLFFLNKVFSGSFTELDALTSTLSIFGMFLLSKSKIEAWAFWILADVIYIYFFFLN